LFGKEVLKVVFIKRNLSVFLNFIQCVKLKKFP